MIADGVLDDPRPDVVFGVHLWAALPLGHVGVARGAMMAAVAASPHETRDTIVAAAHVVTALQTIVARRLSPLLPAVVSVTSMHGGSAFNILPDSVTLRGTCRSFDAEVADRLPSLVREVAEHAARSLGCEAKTVYRRITPAVVNHPHEAERARRVAEALLPRASPARVTAACRTMGGEAFSEFLLRLPRAFAFVGAAPTAPPRS